MNLKEFASEHGNSSVYKEDGKVPVFVYGTLKDPAIISKVIGRTVTHDDATPDVLSGFLKVSIDIDNPEEEDQKDYGTVLRAPIDKSKTKGFIYYVTEEEFHKLIGWEDSYFYNKVMLDSGRVAMVFHLRPPVMRSVRKLYKESKTFDEYLSMI